MSTSVPRAALADGTVSTGRNEGHGSDATPRAFGTTTGLLGLDRRFGPHPTRVV